MWKVWCFCLNWVGVSGVFHNNPRKMFDSWIGVHLKNMNINAWCILFFVLVWLIWNYRNRVIFDKTNVNWECFMVQLSCKWNMWVEDWRKNHYAKLDPSQVNVYSESRGMDCGDGFHQWWLCVHYDVNRDIYVVGGIFTHEGNNPRVSLVYFVEANSVCVRQS